MHSPRETCQSRTVLSIEDDSRKKFFEWHQARSRTSAVCPEYSAKGSGWKTAFAPPGALVASSGAGRSGVPGPLLEDWAVRIPLKYLIAGGARVASRREDRPPKIGSDGIYASSDDVHAALHRQSSQARHGTGHDISNKRMTSQSQGPSQRGCGSQGPSQEGCGEGGGLVTHS